MRLLKISSVLSLLLLIVFAEQLQDSWTFPQTPDRATTIEVGQQITIAWTAKLQTWFPAYCPGCVPTSANLYITSVGISGQVPFKHQVASNVDVTSDLTVKWTVTLPLSEYTCDGCNVWAFTFTEDGYNGDVTSSSFYVEQAGSDSTQSSSTAASTVTSTPNVAFTTIVTLSAQPTATSATTSTGSVASSTPLASGQTTGLDGSVKIGIAIGAVGGASLLFGLGWFLARWSRMKDGDVSLTTPTKSDFGRAPRHRPLADFLGGKGGKGSSPGWDPNDTFFQPSGQGSNTNLDSLGRLTPAISSHELLFKHI